MNIEQVAHQVSLKSFKALQNSQKCWSHLIDTSSVLMVKFSSLVVTQQLIPHDLEISAAFINECQC